MIKFYICLTIFIGTIDFQAQDMLWQKNIKSSIQDFLAPISHTIDCQYLVYGSSIQSSKLSSIDSPSSGLQNNNYDYLGATTSVQEERYSPSGIREIYKYDTANRLQSVVDVNGNILKEYQYHYKGQ